MIAGIGSRPAGALVIVLAFAVVGWGCDQSTEKDGAGARDASRGTGSASPGRPAAHERVDDPAMAARIRSDANARAVGEPPERAEAEPVEPAVFTIDTDTGRVFLPDTGWMTADAFRDIYENRPQELPGGIDHDALMRLWQSAAANIHSSSDKGVAQ